jgi:Zn-finger protein
MRKTEKDLLARGYTLIEEKNGVKLYSYSNCHWVVCEGYFLELYGYHARSCFEQLAALSTEEQLAWLHQNSLADLWMKQLLSAMRESWGVEQWILYDLSLYGEAVERKHRVYPQTEWYHHLTGSCIKKVHKHGSVGALIRYLREERHHSEESREVDEIHIQNILQLEEYRRKEAKHTTFFRERVDLGNGKIPFPPYNRQ